MQKQIIGLQANLQFNIATVLGLYFNVSEFKKYVYLLYFTMV